MTKKIAALGIAVLVVLGSQMLVEAHAGNVQYPGRVGSVDRP